MPRASGKTTLLIKESAKTGRPIIEPNTASARYVEEQAKYMGLIIPEPISATSWNEGYYLGLQNLKESVKENINMIMKDMMNKYGYDIDSVDMCSEGTVIHFSKTIPANAIIHNGEIVMPNEVITDINVIVPDKVVEITFGNDQTEKMVCHKDDTFDLRKCCFIAIAKHLYKKEYTQEGIEYMATQLTYQKKYVKIVDKALKDYKKKEEEKAEKIRREEEEKIIRARQSLKRRKQKERRAQRHREALIDVFADSINEAKTRRKRYEE